MTSEKLVPHKAYPNSTGRRWFVWTGEKRPPRKGDPAYFDDYDYLGGAR